MEHLHDEICAAEINLRVAEENEVMNLFVRLKPSIQKDGDQWCVLYGENLQVGIAGFGNSPSLAIMDFNAEWYKSIPQK